jgi:hypothetical protein
VLDPARPTDDNAKVTTPDGDELDDLLDLLYASIT